MPKPPILPVTDWKAVFESGKSYSDWIAGAENPEKKRAIEDGLAAQPLDPQIEGFLWKLPRVVYVVAIAEDWCGDVVRHVPVLQRLAQACDKVGVRFITREQHKDIFIRFLTNGGEAIPKFIFLSGSFVECGNWGPMPADCRKLIARGKACGDLKKAREKVAALYQADPEKRAVVTELLELIDLAAATVP
ncbi:MAG: thioredoxin family protein [Candidatus Hydrogenedentes bacterium]|nr:thioredoxin family protein [Candidatus Hydrogenedentota bacterium]